MKDILNNPTYKPAADAFARSKGSPYALAWCLKDNGMFVVVVSPGPKYTIPFSECPKPPKNRKTNEVTFVGDPKLKDIAPAAAAAGKSAGTKRRRNK